MTTLADVLRMHGQEYLERYQHNMLPSHKKVMRDILLCKSGYLGWHEWYCPNCRKTHYLNNSCRNRHCPQCQKDKTQNWVNIQQEKLLPVEYFLFTFTIPQQLRTLAGSNQKLFYNILFNVSSQCLQILAKDKRFIGAEIGMIGLLHSWTQTMDYHPHIHYIIPGIALDSQKQTLRYAKDGFLIHVKPLSRLFCYKLKRSLKQAGLKDKILNDCFNGKWVVHGKSVGSGVNAVKYLAQYVYRIAISDRRIVSCKNRMVTFRYKDRDSGNEKFMTLPALEFIRRFLQHVLPKGFQKVRYYGFLHPKRKLLFNQIRLLLNAKYEAYTRQKSNDSFNAMLCPDCGKPMICINRNLIARPPPLNELFRQTAA
jgi:hypothetical protein